MRGHRLGIKVYESYLSRQTPQQEHSRSDVFWSAVRCVFCHVGSVLDSREGQCLCVCVCVAGIRFECECTQEQAVGLASRFHQDAVDCPLAISLANVIKLLHSQMSLVAVATQPIELCTRFACQVLLWLLRGSPVSSHGPLRRAGERARFGVRGMSR